MIKKTTNLPNLEKSSLELKRKIKNQKLINEKKEENNKITNLPIL
jgi:hypothetical protein